MELGLSKIIESITTSPKETFCSNLKENLTKRMKAKVEDKFKNSLKEFAQNDIVVSTKKETKPIVAESKEQQQHNIISSLKESYFNEKTILHKFRDGNTVAITCEDADYLIKMHDNLNIINQEKMRKLMSESFTEYNKILKFSKKHIERIPG
jgi:hypothetical protein